MKTAKTEQIKAFLKKVKWLLTTGSGVQIPPLQPFKTLKSARNLFNFVIFGGFLFSLRSLPEFGKSF